MVNENMQFSKPISLFLILFFNSLLIEFMDDCCSLNG